jgi:hypothetical protein
MPKCQSFLDNLIAGFQADLMKAGPKWSASSSTYRGPDGTVPDGPGDQTSGIITAWLQVRVLRGPPRIPTLTEISRVHFHISATDATLSVCPWI